MRRDDVIATLRNHETELRASGIVGLSLFGSVARGDDQADSDVDVVVRLAEESKNGGFAYFGRVDALTRQLQSILGCHVDLVMEPVRKERLRHAIEMDRARAF